MRNGKAQDIASDDIDLLNIAERAFLFFRRYRMHTRASDNEGFSMVK